MKGSRRVRLTANFERNLEEIERFLEENEAPRAYDDLLAHLGEDILPSLERFPSMGRSFYMQSSNSVEGVTRIEKLRKRTTGKDIRELLTGDYLLLYLDDGTSIFLLTIRHHRQLSYDLPGHWEQSGHP